MDTGTYAYADIIIDISHEKVDKPFQYRIPEALSGVIAIGVRVRIPFGKGNGLRTGYVVGLSNTPAFDVGRMKEIAGPAPGSTPVRSQLIQLAWWMKRTYGCTMNQALKTVLPVKQAAKGREKKTLCCLLDGPALRGAIGEAQKKGYQARARLLSAFLETPELSMEAASAKLKVTASSIRPLVERGVLSIRSEEISKSPVRGVEAPDQRPLLNEEQAHAAGRFTADYDAGVRTAYLLHGITGSGKTEVYMECMEHVLARGRQVILLIPEISLTYQTVMRFYRRFGDKIAILNSRLSDGERFDQWKRAEEGRVSVMIGPRSALFAPFERLGLIIMDEEHEGAYKSETTPRYHAREAARRRAMDSGASLILGSATPSMEAYQEALSGKSTLLRLTQRAVSGSRIPAVEIVDLREELRDGNKSMFSRRLKELIEDRLEKREQIMLFINRRGYSNFISCRSCGEPVRCPHCDVSLTLHGKSRLVCHYCGYSIPMMENCPSCGSPYLAGFGAGTQKLEELAKKEFPGSRILRMDADTTAKKGGHEAILSAFSGHEADILIGTQMIVKGHDFGRVTLVGIMAADLSLNTPDYRCSERTFQLLTQAAGRAGRGERAGAVVFQTYQPDHYAIRSAASQDYEAFYRQEIAYRRAMNYPPLCRMQAVLFSSASREALGAAAERSKEALLQALSENGREEAQFIGPVHAPVYKVNDIYRKILYIKSEKCDILDRIRGILENLAAGNEAFRPVTIQYDIS
ncbi:primosomal protein N' [Clostridiaceae bacterium]|nr:primosomal protein N' [Clostridiaceae bacterium]